MIDPKRTAILFTANTPQIAPAEPFINSLLDPNKGNFQGDLWVLSTGLSNQAKEYLSSRNIKYYINPFEEAYNLKNWEEIARRQPEYRKLGAAKVPEKERLRRSFAVYRNKRMSKLIYLDWARMCETRYDYVAICDNDLYIQNDIHNLFEKTEKNKDAVWYWREEYETLPNTIIWRQNMHYKRLQTPLSRNIDEKEINIGFLIGKPSTLKWMFSEIKKQFFTINTELLAVHGWQDQALTRLLRAEHPDRFQLFDEGDIIHLCNGGRHTVIEEPTLNFICKYTGKPYTVVHFAAGKQKYFPPMAFCKNLRENEYYDYVANIYARNNINELNTWNIIDTESKYVTRETLAIKSDVRKKWIDLVKNKKKKLMFSGWLQTGSHKSLYEKSRELWENPLYNTIILGTPYSGKVASNVLIEHMPECIRHDGRFIHDFNLAKHFGYKFSNIPYNSIAEGVEAFQKDFNSSFEGALSLANIAYMYFKDAVSFYRPDIVALLAFQPAHRIFRKVCEELEIPFFYAEFGILDGTYCFDFLGSMGGSWVTQHHDYFNSLPIEASDLQEAQKYLDKVVSEDLSRNQPVEIPEALKEYITILKKEGKHIILCAGSNDAHSGNIPYNEKNKQMHVPCYKNNSDMLSELSNYAADNSNIHIIYKPHPITSARKMEEISYHLPGVTIVNEGNLNDYIDLCDMTVVNVSQSCYESLQRNKPVLMAGRNQLSFSGAVYNLEDYKSLGEAIEECLSKGFTQDQRKKFIEHIARALKYYVYSYTEGFGRPINRMGTDLFNLMNNKYPDFLKYEADVLQKRQSKSNIKTSLKISIIIPIHNKEHYLAKSINSLINQSYNNLEIICILNGCTDQSEKIVRYFADVDDRIVCKVLSEPNQNKARNYGKNIATGDYLYFMDADDSLDSTAFEELINVFNDTKADCVYFLYREHYSTEKYSLPRWYDPSCFWPDSNVFEITEEMHKTFLQMPYPWMKIYRKKFFKEQQLDFNEDLIRIEDNHQNIQTLLSKGKLYCYKKVLYNYTNIPESLCRNPCPEFMNAILVIKKINEVLGDARAYSRLQPYIVKYKAHLFFYSLSKLPENLKSQFWDSAKDIFTKSDIKFIDDDFSSSHITVAYKKECELLKLAFRFNYDDYKKFIISQEKKEKRSRTIRFWRRHISKLLRKAKKTTKNILRAFQL